MRDLPVRLTIVGCLLVLTGFSAPTPAADGPPRHPHVDDIAAASGFQDSWNNHHLRGRAIVAEDFDGDGLVDYFVGNVGDESLVVRNLGSTSGGVPRFEPVQVLLEEELAFVASAADYDNDADLDIFVGCGGLEGYGLDYLFRNDSAPGRIAFTDVSREAGIRGPKLLGIPVEHATGGATWGDYDRDGDQDLFVSVIKIPPGTISYKNVLWRNNGDGTFRDVTYAVKLNYRGYSGSGVVPIDWGYFQNSTWIDADNDGDLDLFLNNARGPNVLWKNFLVEHGEAWFKDVTPVWSLPGEDLRFPIHSFASAVADFNNDGWQDLMLFTSESEREGPYGDGNGLFLNRQGLGFYNSAKQAGIDMPDGSPEDAMGCQVADLNADGTPDLIMGGGEPMQGGRTRLLLSDGASGEIPLYEDASHLVDFEPQHTVDSGAAPFPELPPYPYRTHGMAAADFDGDGRFELGVINGGRAIEPAIVREPDRLYDFHGPGVGRTLRVRLHGNGTTDSRDAIGARAYVEAGSGKSARRVFQTVLAGSGFSAQNERTLTFGLGRDHATRLAVLWTSGCVQVVELPASAHGGATLVVDEACWSCEGATGPVEAWLDPAAAGCTVSGGGSSR